MSSSLCDVFHAPSVVVVDVKKHLNYFNNCLLPKSNGPNNEQFSVFCYYVQVHASLLFVINTMILESSALLKNVKNVKSKRIQFHLLLIMIRFC